MYMNSNKFFCITLTAEFLWKSLRQVVRTLTIWDFQEFVDYEKMRGKYTKAEESQGYIIRGRKPEGLYS